MSSHAPASTSALPVSSTGRVLAGLKTLVWILVAIAVIELLVIGFGILGYLMMKLDYPPVPLVLGMILGPILERGIRRTLVASDGDLSVFFQSPIALVILLITAVLVASPWLVSKRAKQKADVGNTIAK